MKIYVATRGEYSDFRIVGVFSSEEKLRAALLGNHYDCHEYEIDSLPAFPAGMKAFAVTMKANGDLLYPTAETYSEHVGNMDFRGDNWYGGRHISATVAAKDEHHAVKIVNEQRIQRLASGKWAD